MLSATVLLSASPRPATDLPAEALVTPVSREETYSVNARVRPLLLFWIGRRNVGDARIRWREGPGGERAIDLLVGTDPDRAPRRINRWGFVSEHISGDRLEMVGLMTASDEATLEEARAKVNQPGAFTTYKASRTTIVGSSGTNRTSSFAAPADLTYRDLDQLLARPDPGTQPDRPIVRDSPATTGFLFAIETLMHSVLKSCAREAVNGSAPTVYLHNRSRYTLALESCRPFDEFNVDGQLFSQVADSRFVITNLTSGARTHFGITYGAAGRYQGIPVRAVFRPNWWIEVELVHRGVAAPVATKTSAWRHP